MLKSDFELVHNYVFNCKIHEVPWNIGIRSRSSKIVYNKQRRINIHSQLILFLIEKKSFTFLNWSRLISELPKKRAISGFWEYIRIIGKLRRIFIGSKWKLSWMRRSSTSLNAFWVLWPTSQATSTKSSAPHAKQMDSNNNIKSISLLVWKRNQDINRSCVIPELM